MTEPLKGCKVQPKFHSANSNSERVRISWNSAETSRKYCLVESFIIIMSSLIMKDAECYL